jgi:hypothetical protein
MTAPAHMGQGSSVTYIAQPSSLQVPRARQAWRTASSSAWAEASPVSSRHVAAAADYDPAVRPGDHAAHRHFSGPGGGGLLGQSQRGRHKFFIY